MRLLTRINGLKQDEEVVEKSRSVRLCSYATIASLLAFRATDTTESVFRGDHLMAKAISRPMAKKAAKKAKKPAKKAAKKSAAKRKASRK